VRPIIIWDIDDVLNSLTEEWLVWYKTENNNVLTVYTDLINNPPHDILGISKQEYLKLLDKFRRMHFSTLKPNENVLDWFHKHGDDYINIALTAVPMSFADVSVEWCLKHFGRWIRSFNFIPSPRKSDTHKVNLTSKKEYIQQIIPNAEFFIDDTLSNLHGIEEIGVKAILFPAPWNASAKLSMQECLKQIS
jgi:5'(3')-deoxyribonucleotidase